MSRAVQPSMAEAMRLTRSGQVAEATAMIRTLLGGGAKGAPAPVEADVIDLPFERVTAAPPKPAPTSARAGAATERLYSGPEGELGYRLYLPAGVRAGMPVVVMLHGCTQSPEDFALGTGMDALADELGCIIVYPRQTQAANAQKCWNWFRPGDQERGRGEPARIAGATLEVVREHAADGARVYVAGLSAGGAAAAILAARYPDIYAAVGVHSGLACGAARDLLGALSAMRQGGGRRRGNAARFVPVITFHGDRDNTVHEVNSREIVAAASEALGAPLTTSATTDKTPGGRSYRKEVSTDAAGRVRIEQWTVHGAGHAWSGGDAAGSYTDSSGPDASREMLRFFLQHRLEANVR